MCGVPFFVQFECVWLLPIFDCGCCVVWIFQIGALWYFVFQQLPLDLRGNISFFVYALTLNTYFNWYRDEERDIFLFLCAWSSIWNVCLVSAVILYIAALKTILAHFYHCLCNCNDTTCHAFNLFICPPCFFTTFQLGYETPSLDRMWERVGSGMALGYGFERISSQLR